MNTNDIGWQVNLHVDIGTLTGWGHNFTMDLGYADYGQNFYAPYGAAEIDINQNDFLYPGNANGGLFGIHITPITNWTVYFTGFDGNAGFGNQTIAGYEGGVIYGFAQNATVVFKIRQENLNSVQQFLLYRAQIDYTF
jgi:hypothetical protein